MFSVAAPGATFQGIAAPRFAASTLPSTAATVSVFAFVVPPPGSPRSPLPSCPVALCPTLVRALGAAATVRIVAAWGNTQASVHRHRHQSERCPSAFTGVSPKWGRES